MANEEGRESDLRSEPLAAELKAEAITGRKRRPTGKAPIYLDLESALKIVREKIDSHTKRLPLLALAKALDHVDTTALRFRQKVDALTRYNLVSQEGEEVVLTETAVDALYSTGETRRSARLQAFLSCDDFKSICDSFAVNTEIRVDEVREFVKAKLHIVNAVEPFIKLFLQSAKAAGLYEGGETTNLPEVFKLRSRADLLQDQETGAASEKALVQVTSGDVTFRTLSGVDAQTEVAALGLEEAFNVVEVRVSQPPLVESIVNRNGQAVLLLSRKTEVRFEGAYLKTADKIIKHFGGQENE